MFTKATNHKLKFIFNALLPGYIIACTFYFAWRYQITLIWNTWYAYLLLALEIYGALSTILYLITTRRIPEIENIMLNKIDKKVDILIPTYNEPLKIVKVTALRALAVEGVQNVFILDDGDRKDFKKMAKQIGAKYIARKDNKYAKAGNMNNGLKCSDAEFIVTLDCDHVPSKKIIKRLLGYFKDDNLAFVQTPQTFYNISSLQFRELKRRSYWNEQSMFYESIQPAKNAFNAAFFCGTSAMLRRSAIDSIGGFATETATEDLHTSLKLHAKGWKSLYINEQLAYGLAPEDLAEFHKQRVRWGAGSLGLLFRSQDSPLRARGLTLMQRICYFQSASSFLNGIQKLFYFLLPAFILLLSPFTNVNQEQLMNASYLLIILPFVSFSFLVTYIYSRRTFHPIYTEHFNIANIFSNIGSLRGVIKVQKKFKVATKVKSKKDSHYVYSAIIILWLVMLLANAVILTNWFIVKNGSLMSFLNDILLIAFFWNSFNLVFMGSFINSLRKYNKKEPSHIFNPQALIGYISGKEYLIKAIDFTGTQIMGANKLKNKKLQVVIKKDLVNIPLSAVVKKQHKLASSNYLIDLEFEDITGLTEINLTWLLFHKIIPENFANEFRTKQSLIRRIQKKTLQRRQELTIQPVTVKVIDA